MCLLLWSRNWPVTLPQVSVLFLLHNHIHLSPAFMYSLDAHPNRGVGDFQGICSQVVEFMSIHVFLVFPYDLPMATGPAVLSPVSFLKLVICILVSSPFFNVFLAFLELYQLYWVFEEMAFVSLVLLGLSFFPIFYFIGLCSYLYYFPYFACFGLILLLFF